MTFILHLHQGTSKIDSIFVDQDQRCNCHRESFKSLPALFRYWFLLGREDLEFWYDNTCLSRLSDCQDLGEFKKYITSFLRSERSSLG